VLAAVASTAAVGQYAVAVAITSVLFLLPRSLAGVLLPRVAYLDLQGDDDSRLELVEAKALRHATIVVVTVGIGLALALILLVVPVYGAGFRPAIAPGLILLPGVAAVAIAGVLSATITGRGRPQYSLYTALMTMPVTVMLYLVLIPAYEMTGAALSSTISYAMTLLVTAGFYRRTTGRGVGPLLMPTRSELKDIRGVPAEVLAWRRMSRR
jgi:O-antigen/teichoic acid export membrane protein